jgi:acetate kinase
MGLTPVEGLIMGTRCGDIDAGVLTFIMNKEEISIQTTNTLINKHSGMLGVSGVSSDMRDIEDAAFNKKNERAKLSLEMFNYRIRKYIGAYAAAMNGVDIIVFTGGIGENSTRTREEICKHLSFLGVDFDRKTNEGSRGKEVVITKPDSKVKVIIVPTNEEFVIAEDTVLIVCKKHG